MTNPERFRPLHNAALQLIDELARRYAVTRNEAVAPEAVFAGIELVHPIIELAPQSTASASIQVSFTAFPGVLLRFGRFCTEAFPSCGCDACDETVEEEIARLQAIIVSITDGSFREVVRVGLTGKAWLQWELSFGTSRAARGREIQRSEHLPGRGRREKIEWAPWPRRV